MPSRHGAKVSEFYHSRKWDRIRTLVRSRDNHICQRCRLMYLRGIIQHMSIGTEVHHIVELDELNVDDENISSDMNNLVLLCHDCHNHITSVSQGGTERGRCEFAPDGSIISIREVRGSESIDSLFYGKGRNFEGIRNAIESSRRSRG